MEGQMTFRDYEASYTHERDGKRREAPKWAHPERCGTCKNWHLLPVEDQPPCGWGVKGQCQIIYFPNQLGYQNTGELSYCDRFEWRC